MTFIPFDATEEEIAAKSIIREGLPGVIAEPLKRWLNDTYPVDYYGYAATEFGLAMQLKLDCDFGIKAHSNDRVGVVVQNIYGLGEKAFMRVIDYLLATHDFVGFDEVVQLTGYLDSYRSKYKVEERDGIYRLGIRLPEGVEETFQEAVNMADATAARLLTEAWEYSFGVDQKPEEAMDKAVKAVERAATPIICPNHPAPSLGNAISDLRNQGDWTHGLRANDKAPAGTTIHHMMQTLWFGQQYRHVDKRAVAPTIEQARTHVMLAAVLVGWFASGEIARSAIALSASDSYE